MTHAKTETRPLTGAGSPASQQVDWWPVHTFAQALIQHPEALPLIGTIAWQQLDHDDQVLSCIAAAPHYALHLEGRQIALAQTSKDIAASANWATVARSIQRRESGVYIPRRKEIA